MAIIPEYQFSTIDLFILLFYTTIYIFIIIVLLLHIVYATYWYAIRIIVLYVQAQLHLSQYTVQYYSRSTTFGDYIYLVLGVLLLRSHFTKLVYYLLSYEIIQLPIEIIISLLNIYIFNLLLVSYCFISISNNQHRLLMSLSLIDLACWAWICRMSMLGLPLLDLQ